MNKQKSSILLLFWLLVLLALVPFWMSFSAYQKQVSNAAILKSELSGCSYFVKTTKYSCLSKVEGYLPKPEWAPVLTGGVLFAALLLAASYQTLSFLQEKNKKASQDLLDVLIGSKHSQDVLGEIYQISYLNKQNKITPKTRYLLGLLDECLRRITTYYQLTPVGLPGDGPLLFAEKEHVALGHILPNENVWIAQVGWRQNDKIILPSMVSKDPNQLLDGDWQ
ncbi:MAG TPA: hypothetical protein PKL78_10565 [Anaerolineales bacterium]|nr:hypothetical protein [Anaerolineales bacterium]